ncbi:MAG: diguanylate cyclase [Acidobacteria bacterium]|nr:diguanylate cyclase [Acidobacteriota bacterium]
MPTQLLALCNAGQSPGREGVGRRDGGRPAEWTRPAAEDVTPPTRSHADARAPKAARTFRALPVAMQAYLATLVLAGAGLAGWASGHLGLDQMPLFLALLLAANLTSAVKIQLPLAGGGSTLSLSYVVNFAAILCLDPGAVTLIAVTSAWSQCTFRVRQRNPAYQTLFSMAALGVAATASGWTYGLVLPAAAQTATSELGAAVVAATVYFLLNTLLVAAAVALSTQDRILLVWKRDFLRSSPTYYIGALVGAVVVLVVSSGGAIWVPVLAVPVYFCYRIYKSFSDRVADERQLVRQGADLQMDVIEALALAIEAQSGSSHQRLLRIQNYAEGLARSLGLEEREVRGVRTAALLHDVGNLAVPEHILAKRGPLTFEEFECVKAHPRVGAEILQEVPFPYPVSRLILAHHERWDGRGYPLGLKGADIPLGARILSVVDCFAAMLEDRPFRPARAYAEAIATTRENAGSSLDPGVVETFIEILPHLESRLQADSRLARADGSHDESAAGRLALDRIALTHREEQILNEIGHALSASLRVADVIALVSTRLVNLVPFTSSAAFLLDDASGLYLCRHVNGPHAEAIRGLAVATTERLGATLPDLASAQVAAGVRRLRSVLVAPLTLGERAVGALVFYHVERDAYNSEHRRLVTRVAAQAAPVVWKALSFELAHEQSETDLLTEITNRRGMERQLAGQLIRAERHASHASVLFFDVDRLKRINDVFGHQAGDRALQAIGRFLVSHLRGYDVCARYAGDEFVVVLGDCDTLQAEGRRMAVQDGVASLDFEPEPGRRLPLSISGGTATFPADGRTADELIAVADRRMYEDKSSRATGGSGAPGERRDELAETR